MTSIFTASTAKDPRHLYVGPAANSCSRALTRLRRPLTPLERVIAIAVSATRAWRLIPKVLSASNDELTEMMREIVSSLYAFMLQIDERIKVFDRKIAAIFKASAVCQRIAKIRGIGPKTATAMIAAIGDGSDFKNGRHLSAWPRLVPRQHSSSVRKV